MDHRTVDEQQVVERYLMGRLSAEEAARFEEHYLGCQECLDRLEEGERFHRALKAVATEEAARAAVGAGVLAALARLGRWRLAAAVLALLALLALPAAFLAWQGRSLESRLARAEAELAESRRQLAEGRERGDEASAELEEQLAQLQRRAAAETAALEDQLASAEAAGERLARELERWRRPQVNPPVLHLSLLRSGGTGGGPDVRFTLGREPEWIVLALEVDGVPGQRYGAALLGPGGGEAWRGESLEAGADGTVTLSFPSTFFDPGIYRLRLAPLEPGGEPGPPVELAFQVLAAP